MTIKAAHSSAKVGVYVLWSSCRNLSGFFLKFSEDDRDLLLKVVLAQKSAIKIFAQLYFFLLGTRLFFGDYLFC